MDPQQAQQPATEKTKTKKEKSTFMLHCPNSLEALAKLSSVDFRYAALKVASRIEKLPENLRQEDGSLRIWLRKTNTKIVREYNGNVITLETPQEVIRQGRKIVYTKKPQVKYVKKMLWEELASPEKAAEAPQEEAPALA